MGKTLLPGVDSQQREFPVGFFSEGSRCLFDENRAFWPVYLFLEIILFSPLDEMIFNLCRVC